MKHKSNQIDVHVIRWVRFFYEDTIHFEDKRPDEKVLIPLRESLRCSCGAKQ